MDAAKGIALGAVNPARGAGLDYSNTFENPALPIVAVPITAGTGAEVNAFGVVTDVDAHRKFYVGHESALPKAAVLDPELTLGLPPMATAATGMDALTHAIESYSSIRQNPTRVIAACAPGAATRAAASSTAPAATDRWQGSDPCGTRSVG